MSEQSPARAAIDPAYTWDLTGLYTNDTDWEAAFQRAVAALPEFDDLRGRVTTTANNLLHALTLRDRLAASIDRLVLYAELRRDQDTTDAASQARADRAVRLQANFGASIAFVQPEILALSEQSFARFVHEVPTLETYRFYVAELLRQHAHIQSPEIEAVLAEATTLTETPQIIFGAIKDADFVAPTIADGNGDTIAVTHGRYWALLRGTQRHVRRDAYHAYTARFQELQHTHAATLAGAIRRDMFLARVRHYPSALHAALDPDDIPIEVYHTLIRTVTQYVPLLHRYLRLRRRALDIESLHFYDLWVPLTTEMPPVAYDDGRQIVLQALAPLGSDYLAVLRHGLYDGRWVDVYEADHKRSGAYSAGAFQTSPFILLNWQHKLSDLYTLAHEAGHAMHTYIASQHQPYIYSRYNIFVAEVASTCNEVLLSDYLLARATDPRQQRYIVSQQLQRMVELIFWQALLAEFDSEAHTRVEAGESLTASWLSETLARLQHKYYGETVVFDTRASLLWAQFPHFYLNFYVYKFATGMVAALALAQQICTEGQPAIQRYLTFLQSGSSNTAIDLLRHTGVDMTTARPIELSMNVFTELLDRLEAVLYID